MANLTDIKIKKAQPREKEYKLFDGEGFPRNSSLLFTILALYQPLTDKN